MPDSGLMSGILLIFIGTSPRLFLQSFTEQVAINAQGAWMGIALNSLIAFFMMYIVLFVLKRHQGDFLSITHDLLGIGAFRVISLYYFLVFLINAALLLRSYTESTQLTALPEANFHAISLLFAVTIGIALFQGIESILRTSYFVVTLLILGSLLVVMLLYPFYQVYYLLPPLGNGVKPILTSGFRGAGYNTAAIAIFILASLFQNRRTIQTSLIWGLGGAFALKFVYILCLICVLGTEVSAEKVLPFFELARLVFINRYLQRIEALLIMIWAMFGVLAIAASLYIAVYLIARLFQLTTPKPLFPLLTALTVGLSILPQNFDQLAKYDNMFVIFEIVGIYIIPLLLLLSSLIKGKKRVCSSARH